MPRRHVLTIVFGGHLLALSVTPRAALAATRQADTHLREEEVGFTNGAVRLAGTLTCM
jgi:hypothetical protein